MSSYNKYPKAQIHFTTKDKEAVQAIRDTYGCKTISDAVRLAIHAMVKNIPVPTEQADGEAINDTQYSACLETHYT